jgi:hypothetical protein
MGEEHHQLIEELIERGVATIGLDESKEIHHVVRSRDNIINGLLLRSDSM